MREEPLRVEGGGLLSGGKKRNVRKKRVEG